MCWSKAFRLIAEFILRIFEVSSLVGWDIYPYPPLNPPLKGGSNTHYTMEIFQFLVAKSLKYLFEVTHVAICITATCATCVTSGTNLTIP